MSAHKCPVCEGRGKTGWLRKRQCHGCQGKGWVEVKTSDALAACIASLLTGGGFPWRPLAALGIIIGGGYLLCEVLDP